MKKLFVVFVLLGLMVLAWNFRAGSDSTNRMSGNHGSEAGTEAASADVLKKITDKNIAAARQTADPFIVAPKKDMDPFWGSFLPDMQIQNEWIYPETDGCSIAIFGALKDNPQQGIALTVNVNSKNELVFIEQFFAPVEGGPLSVIDEPSSKDYIMDVQDETGRIYLFNFSNGFTAFMGNAAGSDKDPNANTKGTGEDALKKITDKNIAAARQTAGPFIVAAKKDMDPFWDSFLPDTQIQNEWIYPETDGCSIAIFGALKDNPQQGTVTTIEVNAKNEAEGISRFFAPYEGGALQVTGQPSPQDQKVQDKTGRVYLFTFSSGLLCDPKQ